MRTVLHLINTGGPGGAETVYVELVRGLDPARWRSVVVLPNHEWMYEQLRGWSPAPVVDRSLRPFDLRYFRVLRRLVREHRVDVVHGHFFGPAVVASLLGMACGIPAVGTLHGTMDAASEGHRALKRALLNRGLKRAVFVSEPLRRAFVGETGVREGITAVIPNGIDAAVYAPGGDGGARAELGIGAGEFVVGAVGNLRPAKGYDVLLRAAALLANRGDGWRFVVVGQAQGEIHRELLEMRDALGLRERVIFTGFREDVPRLLRSFDAFALTSVSEGFSLSTVQAMAAGLPVVATRCGGPEELLEDGRTGVLVENGSADAVAAALARLRADPDERRRLGGAALEAARERFTVRAQVRAYERLYDEVIPARRRSRMGSSAPTADEADREPALAAAEGGGAWKG
jgi:glycosyltransferase involved in cell wall biosynthesis